MATIYLVRHGKAAAGFGTHKDPGLDETGQRQARRVADFLHTKLPEPVAVSTSPLARAFETAQPLAGIWGCDIAIEPRVAEIPSPTEDLSERAAWLGQAMQGNWSELEPRFQQWRADVGECLMQTTADTVFFSHFVAINAAVGLAQDDPRMRVFSPDNCSVTILTNHTGKLQVQELGLTAETHIN